MESRFLGFEISKSGKNASFKIRLTDSNIVSINIYGIEKLIINEVREQNIIEEISFWPGNSDRDALRAAAFWLFGNSPEEDCVEAIKSNVQASIDRIVNGDLMLMDGVAIYGAEVLAAFLSMDITKISENIN